MSELEKILAKRRAKEVGLIWADEIPFDSLEHKVFLGDGRDASQLEKLRENNITHILNVANDVPNYVSDKRQTQQQQHASSSTDTSDNVMGSDDTLTQKEINSPTLSKESMSSEAFVYCNLNVGDFGTDQGIMRVFDTGAKFVKDGRIGIAVKSTSTSSNRDTTTNPTHDAKSSQPEPVAVNSGVTISNLSVQPDKGLVPVTGILIHCANGSNRSATLTIATVMILERTSLSDAYKRVKVAHPKTMPLKDNIQELLKFELKFFGKDITANSMMEEDF